MISSCVENLLDVNFGFEGKKTEFEKKNRIKKNCYESIANVLKLLRVKNLNQDWPKPGPG